MAPVEDIGLMDFDRSNKGASKQRRDQINAEIATMRDLLPLPESSRQRLSQLQIMSLTCVYIRKCNVLQKLFRTKPHDSSLPDSLDFFQALTGFLLVTTREGKLLYISENVTDFLGHSMVDMKTQGDSLYDIVDNRDQATVQAQLMAAGPPDPTDPQDVSFFCRMNMSRTLKRQSGFGDVKVMHVRGHFIRVVEPGSHLDGQCVFMATCSPLITSELKEYLVQNNTMVFKTVHKLDMTYLEVTNIAEYHLGYTCDELTKQSWYSMIHPEDIHEAKEKHVQLIRSNHEMGSMMTVRMLHADGSSFWVNIVMHVRQASLSQNDEPLVVCINQVINAKEAYQIKVQSHLFSMYPSRAHELWSSQLSSVNSGQEMPVGHWVQQSGNNSVPVPGYQTPMPSCMTPQGRPPLYHVQCPPGMAMTQSSKSNISLSPGSLSATSMVQSDKLKAMLKRKIQGPPPASCRPTKIAKMNWNMDDGHRGNGLSDGHRGMSLMDGYGHVQMAMSYDGHQGQSLQVMQPTNYRLGGVLTAHRESQQVLTCRGIPAPVLTKSTVITEQVVPDVNLPESYLTPDPSPVSSPQPSLCVSVKTEVMEPEDTMTQTKSSTSILQALEKLATLTQDAKSKKILPRPLEDKQSNSVKDVATSAMQRRKELPIFDAFEIDKFFDTLGIPDSRPKTSNKMKMEIKQEIKTEMEEQTCPGNIPNILNMKEEQRSVPGLNSPPSVSPTLNENHFGSSFNFSPSNSRNLTQENSCRFNNHSTPNSPACERQNVSSVMASPAHSVASQEGNFPDLLSCFSENGLDLSPLQMDPSSIILDSTVRDKLLEDQSDSSFLKDFYQSDDDQKCNGGLKADSPRLSEELSPHSTSSSLVGDEELIEDSSAFTLAMALEDLGSDNDSCNLRLKKRDVLGVTEEIKQLDFLLGTI